MKYLKLFFTFLTLTISGSVLSADAKTFMWTCAYPGFSKGSQVLREFRQSGNSLKGLNEYYNYIILQDTEVGLVAAQSLAIKDRSGLRLGAQILVINKKTGELLYSPFFFNVGDDGKAPNVKHRRGKCSRKEVH